MASNPSLFFGNCTCANLKQHHLEVLKDVVAMIQHGEYAKAIVEISKETAGKINRAKQNQKRQVREKASEKQMRRQ